MLSFLFATPTLREWYAIQKNTKSNLLLFKAYLDRYLIKVALLQEIDLKITDFRNGHFFEERELKHLYSVQGYSTQLFRTIHKYLLKRIDKLQQEILYEFKTDRREEGKLAFLHKELAQFIRDDEVQVSLKALEEFEGKMRLLESNLRGQLQLVNTLGESFHRFIGDEKKWEQTHESAEYRIKRRKIDSLDHKEEFFAEWRIFLDQLQRLKQLIAEESFLLFKKQFPTESIAHWEVLARQELARFSIPSLSDVLKKTEKVLRHSKERKMELFHATERFSSLLPLREGMFDSGFYVCIDRKEYALKIKTDQTPDLGANLRVAKLKVPVSVFKELFLEDKQEGRPGDALSEVAYDHAFVLPVSRFPVFNKYYLLGLIEEG